MPPILRKKIPIISLLIAAGCGSAGAAVPFDSAKVTRVQNDVVVGGREAAEARPARVAETVRQNQYVRTATKSRAELQFPDESFVRIGQNTVFTFEGGTRTVSLKKGALLFYVKPGSGNGVIETPALTAAITGTVGLAYVEGGISYLVVIHGVLQTKFGQLGPPKEGFGLKMDQFGNITEVDLAEIKKGRLYTFGGVIPDFGEFASRVVEAPDIDVSRLFDLLEITQLNPAVRAFLNTPVIRPERVEPNKPVVSRPEKNVEVKKPVESTPTVDDPPAASNGPLPETPPTIIPPVELPPNYVF